MFSPKFKLRGGMRLADAVLDSLGDLERAVIVELSRLPEGNVNQVNAGLQHRYAYTTVMTTLDRLFKKGLLERRKDGRAFVYSVKYSLEEMERGVAADVVDRLLNSSVNAAEPVLACIVDSVSERDVQLLDELERLVREKRSELEKKGLA